MRKKKTILILMTLFCLIWFFQYFLSYIPGVYTFVVLFLGTALWTSLSGIAVYQIIKFIVEGGVIQLRLYYILSIIILIVTSIFNPSGLVDWEKYEKDSILTATRIGTVNCQTIIQLRSNNRFKYTSICFGRDFYFGSFSRSNDTLYLYPDRKMPYIEQNTFAILVKWPKDSSKYSGLILYQNFESKRSIHLGIREMNMSRL